MRINITLSSDSPSISDFEAYNDDIAQGKTATESSVAYSGPASLAVDGNTDGSFYDGSVTHTNNDTNAWWQVDLGAVKPIGTIDVFNRTDCCSSRLTDYWVFISTTPFTTTLSPAAQATASGVVWSSHQTGQAGTPTTLGANAAGRYVMVQLAGTNYLNLAEVEVHAPQ